MQDRKPTKFSPEGLRRMRKERNLSLKDFWGAMGYTASRGCCYETGKSAIPEHVRRLVYLEYVMGIPTNIDCEDFKAFETALQSNNPVRVNHVKKLMENALEELKK